MKRILATLVGLVALLGSVVVAQAATLALDAGTLQALRVDAPELDTAEVTLRARWTSVGGGQSGHTSSHEKHYEVIAGANYEVRWVGIDSHSNVNLVACGDTEGWTDLGASTPHPYLFAAVAKVEHRFMLCVEGPPGQRETSLEKFRLYRESDGSDATPIPPTSVTP
jgi:hypothetical protein